jgi:hypothetical protein
VTDEELRALVEASPEFVETRSRLDRLTAEMGLIPDATGRLVRDPTARPRPLPTPKPRPEAEAVLSVYRECARVAGCRPGAEDAVARTMADPSLRSEDPTADEPSLDERVRHAQRTLPSSFFRTKPNGTHGTPGAGFDPTA